MKKAVTALFVVAIALAAVEARAEEGAGSSETGSKRGFTFGFAATIGEGMYFIDHHVYRGPVSLEVVPSIGWSWFKFDLGLYWTVESLRISDTRVGFWNFTFRPGGRLTPPMIPLYLRIAFPLQIQQNDFDWGVMLGLGADIHIYKFLGIVLEVDTSLTNRLDWGGNGAPLEFRIGVSFWF